MCAWTATIALIIAIIATSLVPPNPEIIAKRLQEYADKVCAKVWYDYKALSPDCTVEDTTGKKY